MESENNIEKENVAGRRDMMRIGIAANHGGFELKLQLLVALTFAGYMVKDFGAWELVDSFLKADFKAEERFIRRLDKVAELEKEGLH